jgi:hypothetical protein
VLLHRDDARLQGTCAFMARCLYSLIAAKMSSRKHGFRQFGFLEVASPFLQASQEARKFPISLYLLNLVR